MGSGIYFCSIPYLLRNIIQEQRLADGLPVRWVSDIFIEFIGIFVILQ